MYIGITGEWNPFHKGHAHLVSALRKQFGSVPIVSVMSGAFVQRGEPALFDKWTRARWAVQAGIDAVIELPALCAVQSADRFAEAAVLLLSDLGCTHIAFGAESASAEELQDAVSWTKEPAFSTCFRSALDEGCSYAAAIKTALAAKSSVLSEKLTLPNNMLDFQYVAAAAKHDLPLKFIAIPRDTIVHPISGSRIRQELLSPAKRSMNLTIPIGKEASELIHLGRFTDPSRYADACHLAGRISSEDALTASGLFSEGLEHRWHEYIQENSYEQALQQIKSKRYVYSRLKRTGAALLLSLSDQPSPFAQFHRPLYARLLALRETRSPLLKQSALPIIVSPARARQILSAKALTMLEMDIRSTDVQYFCFANPAARKGRADYYQSPLIL